MVIMFKAFVLMKYLFFIKLADYRGGNIAEYRIPLITIFQRVSTMR